MKLKNCSPVGIGGW